MDTKSSAAALNASETAAQQLAGRASASQPTTALAPAEFTVDDFLAWARTQPPSKEYQYGDTERCALCHYFLDRGIGFQGVGGSFWTDPHGNDRDIPEALERALIGSTYGELVERIEQGVRWS